VSTLKVGHHVLLLAKAHIGLLKAFHEAFEVLDSGLAHLPQHVVRGVLGGNAELAWHVVLDQLFDELVVESGEVIANPGVHVDLAYAGELARLA